jgi:hypothetical protein
LRPKKLKILTTKQNSDLGFSCQKDEVMLVHFSANV